MEVFRNLFLLANFLVLAEGAGFTLVKDKETIEVGDTVVITCTKDTALTDGITWEKIGTTGALTRCLHTKDTCVPSVMNTLRFTSDVANRKFYITITNAWGADSGTYTCKDTGGDGSITILIEVPTTGTSAGPARSDEEDGLSEGAIAGVVIGAIAGVALIAVCIVCAIRLKIKRSEARERAHTYGYAFYPDSMITISRY